MYQIHPVFEPPKNENAKLWRYMDFTKLVSLLASSRLFFARADKLGDPFEGSWPKANIAARKAMAPSDASAEEKESVLRVAEGLSKISEQWIERAAVNCWHMSEYESAACWKLYLKSMDEGIAVQSTYSRLRDSMIDEEAIYLGRVKYIDYEQDLVDGWNLLASFVHKRRSFEHEKEVRALVSPSPHNPIVYGIPIRVDIEKLVEKICVSPGAAEWFSDLVKEVVLRLGYPNIEVTGSQLDVRPVY